MADFALDPVTRDLVLPPRVVTGPERVAQAVGIRLRCWLSEWFLDLEHGVPYLTGVLGKRRPEMVEAILRQQILSVDGVRGIQRFTITIDPRTRVATVSFQADTDEGTAQGELGVSL